MSLRTISLRLLALAILTTAALAASPASAQIRITEVMSSSGLGGTEDWFEVTNYGTTSVNITGWGVDDGSFNFGTVAALNGVTSIGPRETVVFVETATADASAEVAAFRTFWGGAASTVAIGTYAGSSKSFSSNGDGVVVFDSAGNEMTPQTSFGAATGGSSFYWAYDAAGDFVTGFGTQSAGVVSAVGTIPGTFSDQVTFTSADALGNIGSPGTALNAVPEPSSIVLAAFAGLGLAGYAARRRSRKATPAAA